MTPAVPQATDSSAASGRSGAGRARLVGFMVGLALLAAALYTITRSRDAVTAALLSLQHARMAPLLAAAVLPLASLALTSAAFWLLMGRFGRVGFGEMQALIGAAWLLNYLPFWPGMIGRLAYHRAINRIPITSSATALVWANVLNALAAIVVGAAVMCGSIFFEGDEAGLSIIIGAPAVIVALMSVYARRRKELPDPHLWRLLATLAVRMVEMQVWAARYVVCFALIGSPIAWGAAVALASATQLATLIPLGGNALGWREWVTGLVAPLLPLGLSLTTTIDLHTGLTADLVNRAIEVALAVPVGIVCAIWVGRKMRRVAAESRA